jgi:DNA-binding NtrC family response regulator
MPQPPSRALIVDDEPNICRTCAKILASLELEIHTALDGAAALALVEENPFDVVVTDLKMTRLGGMEVLRRIKEKEPDTRVIVMTGYASVASAVEVMKLGAFDYLPKPFTPEELRAVVSQALSDRRHSRRNRRLLSAAKTAGSAAHQLIGNSPKIRKVISMVRKVAPTDATVCIYGESGTGKELIARSVHANSNRNERVFFAVDCGTLSGNLLESELFGYARGAFTGAVKEKLGIFKMADRGTVFLDEISNISLEVQGKLLRFLETQDFIPLGSTKVECVDVRLIFATNRNLEALVADGAFREDFYYRIYVYPIILPPLRERRSDILPIAYHFLSRFTRDVGKKIAGFDEEAARRLTEFDWPGNVRQLRNVVERAVILCERETVGLKDMPLLGDLGEITALVGFVPETNEELKQVKKEIRQKAVGRVERAFVLNALARSDWNVTRAAANAGMQRTNFHSLMKKYAISAGRPEKADN